MMEMAKQQKFPNEEAQVQGNLDQPTNGGSGLGPLLGERKLEFLKRVRNLFVDRFPNADRTPETLR